MNNEITTNGTIISVCYKSTSYYGNPSYWVTFEDEKGNYYRGYTGTNYSVGYKIGSGWENIRAKITYHVTRAGNIIINNVDKLK